MENLFSFEPTEYCPHCNSSLRPGATVTLVPYGALVTIQYSSEGRIEKLYFGSHECGVDVSARFLNSFVVGQLVPLMIPLTGGTSWVTGVVTTNTLVAAEGEIPGAINELVLSADVSELNFSAAYIVSNALGFNNPKAMQHVLKTYGFRILPFWTVPYGGLSQTALDSWMCADNWQYPMQLIMMYIQYIDGKRVWCSTGLHQDIIVDAVQDINYADGEIRVKATYGAEEDELSFLYVPMGQAVKFNIQRGTLIVRDSTQSIVSTMFDGQRKAVEDYRCSCCGKVTKIPTDGPLYCSNAHCGSRMVERVKLMLNVFNLPAGFTDNEWYKLFKDKDLLCLTDVFTLNSYKDMTIEIPLYKILRALVPVSLIRSNDIFIQLANKCNNKVATFQYYIANYDHAPIDLGFIHPDSNKLSCWLSDPANASDVSALLMLPNLRINEMEHSFDGAPIFRNQVLCITGRFKHGSTEDMIHFLQSYSAKVVTDFSSDVTYVIVGSLREGVDGTIITKATNAGIRVVEEDAWFAQFELESDYQNLQ